MYFDQMGYLQITLQDLHFAQNFKMYLNLPLPSTAHLLVSFAQWHKFQIIIILLFPFNLWACWLFKSFDDGKAKNISALASAKPSSSPFPASMI